MSDLVLIDAVQFGLTESEKQHPAYGQLADFVPDDPQVAYGRERFIPDLGGVFGQRQTLNWYGLMLRVPEDMAGRPGRLDIGLQGHQVGKLDGQRRSPTALYLMSRTRLHNLGEILLPDLWTWHSYSFELPGEVLESGPLYLIVDDRRNMISSTSHFHHALGAIELYVRPSEPIAPTIRPDCDPDCDVILLMCPVWDIRMPPIALGAMASYLTDKGLKVQVLDFNIEQYHATTEDQKKIWHGSVATRWEDPAFIDEVLDWMRPGMEKTIERIAASGASHVGFSLATTNAAVTQTLSARLKQVCPEKKIVYGGPGVPFLIDGGLGESYDYLILGAGEHAFYKLIVEGPDQVVGLVGSDTTIDFDPIARRAKLTDLNELPLIDYSAFDLTRYTTPWKLPLVTSRGCVNKCKYCFDAGYYAPFRFLSGRRAFEQLAHLYRRHGRRRFEFADLLCNGDLNALREMCRLILEAGLPLEWGSFAIIRPDMTAADFKLLHQAGCRYLHYGFETGSEMLLEVMGRNYTTADAAAVLRDTHEAGIKVKINIMVGFPGETQETIDDTIDFIRTHGRNIDIVETVNPVYLMTSTDLDKRRDKWEISAPDGDAKWVAGEVDMDLRRAWVQLVIQAVIDAGVTCKYSVIEDFENMDVCVHGDDDQED